SGSPLRPSGEAFWSMFMLKLSDCWLITSPCLRPMGPRQSGWACDPAGSARAGGGADQGRLEEDAQGHLGLHGAVAVLHLLELHVGDAGDARQLLELEHVAVEAVEVARKNDADGQLVVVAAARRRHRLE